MASKKNIILEDRLAYGKADDQNIFFLMEAVRDGIGFTDFQKVSKKSPFTIHEWSAFLHMSDRTMQRYKKEKKTFDSLQSEKIIQIMLLYQMGAEVFGSSGKFDQWLDTDNLALGKIKPKTLLDNAFGISLLKDELTRMEHGVLA